MYCKNCGAQIPDDAKFCSNCGESHQYTSKAQQIDNENRWSLSNKLALIGVMFAIVATIAAIVVIPQVQEGLVQVQRETSTLPQEAHDAVFNYIQESLPGMWGKYSQSIVQASQQGIPGVNTDELWCVLLQLVPTPDPTDKGIYFRYWIARRTGLLWRVEFLDIVTGGPVRAFREVGCSIG